MARRGANPIAGRKAVDPLADLDDRSGNLMPNDNGIVRPGIAFAKNAHVGAADRAGLHFDEQGIITWNRDGLFH
jgi:hypothetical protein